jgi:hypothetical protein
MKKNILFFAILLNLMPSIKTYAQGTDVLSIYSILSGSSQHVKGDIPNELKQHRYKLECTTQFGTGIGVTYKFYKTNFVTLGVGLEYMQQGSEISLPSPNSDYEVMIGESKNYDKIHYISVPMNINLYLYKNAYNPYLLFGARMNFSVYFDPDYPAYGLRLNTNPTTFSCQIGAGCELSINKFILLLPQIRYNNDLNYAVESNYGINNFPKFKNYSFDFLLGVKIR